MKNCKFCNDQEENPYKITSPENEEYWICRGCFEDFLQFLKTGKIDDIKLGVSYEEPFTNNNVFNDMDLNKLSILLTKDPSYQNVFFNTKVTMPKIKFTGI